MNSNTFSVKEEIKSEIKCEDIECDEEAIVNSKTFEQNMTGNNQYNIESKEETFSDVFIKQEGIEKFQLDGQRNCDDSEGKKFSEIYIKEEVIDENISVDPGINGIDGKDEKSEITVEEEEIGTFHLDEHSSIIDSPKNNISEENTCLKMREHGHPSASEDCGMEMNSENGDYKEEERFLDRKSKLLALRRKIVELNEAKKSRNQIARELGVSIKTVRKWIRASEESGDLSDRPRPGGPRNTTFLQDLAIINCALKNPCTNANEIQKLLNIEGSKQTIRRRLTRAGMKYFSHATRIKLTQSSKAERIEFAKEYNQKDINFWSRVIFAQGKTFCYENGKVKCLSLYPTDVIENTSSERVVCKVWGWVNYFTLGEITSLRGQFTPEKYLEILEEVFLPTVKAYVYPDSDRFLYIHENNKIHRSRRVHQWFEENVNYIKVLQWPKRGCDLNPMENVWASIVKDWVPQGEETKQVFDHHITTSWENMRKKQYVIEESIKTIPSRLKSLIENDGEWTSY